MKLDDAFKESNIPAAKRIEGGYEITIHKFSSQHFLMRRFIVSSMGTLTFLEETTHPHLGALLNYCLRQGYKEVKRYAKDWQPLFYASKEKVQHPKSFARKTPTYEEDRYVLLNEEGDYLDVKTEAIYNSDDVKLDAYLDTDGFLQIKVEDDEDYDLEEDIIYGLDGKFEYNGRYDDDE